MSIKNIFSKSEKHTLKLRPVKNGKDSFRLGLYTAEFLELACQKDITSLYVDFGNGPQSIKSTKTYVKYGSITSSKIVNPWLCANGYTSPDQQLLFELEISDNGHCHTYRYKGEVKE